MKDYLIFCFTVFFVSCPLFGQEIGANFNHNPEIIDFKYLEKANVDWVRSTPRILDFTTGKLRINDDPGLEKMKEAGERGYKIAFGFRWDFKQHNMRIPKPSSREEQELFDTVVEVLNILGPHIDVFKLGNEPNLETLPEDMEMNSEGYIPLVRFTERLLEEVVVPFYERHENMKRPDIYVGSFPRLFMEEEQKKEGIRAMINLANDHVGIDGLAVHLHISDSTQIDESFQFVRSLMPDKPIVVPEFSYHRLYTEKLDEPLTSTEKGERFVKKYNRNPDWKLYDWFGHANRNGVSTEEWTDLFATLEWFPHNNLLTYYDRFEKYGVVLATYPIFQQSAPENMNPDSPAWFINPVFAQKSLLKQPDGDYSPNPLHYRDFLEIVQKGKRLGSLHRKDKKAIHLADPTIFLHNNTYYLYGTTAGSKEATGEGFYVYTSPDLENWKGPQGANEGFALKKGDVFGTEGFWAPQVFRYNDKFYMAYTANEEIAIATSDSPLGPFKNSGEEFKAPGRQIDPYIFFDDDGRKYLFHVRLEEGNRIFVAELNDDLMSIKPETLRECMSAKEIWENTQEAKWPVVEGPTVIKEDGLYYLIYSANDFRNPDYAVGIAKSRNPLGPWQRLEDNPIISRLELEATGPGHGDAFRDKAGRLQYVFHTHFSSEAVRPRKTAIVEMKFSGAEKEDHQLKIDRSTVRYLKKN